MRIWKGGIIVVNVNKLRGKIVEKGFSVEKLAKATELDTSTLYRRLKGGGLTFTISEAEKIATVLELSAVELNEIFFA